MVSETRLRELITWLRVPSEDDERHGVLVTAIHREIADKVEAALITIPDDRTAEDVDVHLLAWAVINCHVLARRRLHRDSVDAEWWGHVLRICEKAGARSNGVLRASLPTEITDGGVPSAPTPPDLEK